MECRSGPARPRHLSLCDDEPRLSRPAGWHAGRSRGRSLFRRLARSHDRRRPGPRRLSQCGRAQLHHRLPAQGAGPFREHGEVTAEHVLHRSTTARPPVAVGGEGIYLIDSDGRRYVDACGGAAVSCLGHGNRVVIDAIAEQSARLEFVHTGIFTSDAAEELAAVIADLCPGSLDRVWFTSSGSEATEAALKLARQYHLERGHSGRSKVITRRLSYHGNTLGALAAGGSMWRRKPYEPLLI